MYVSSLSKSQASFINVKKLSQNMWWCFPTNGSLSSVQCGQQHNVLCNAAILSSCINLQITNIAVQWISAFSDFDSPLYWFQWNVLFHAQLPFEGNHCFIHGKILTRLIFFSTGLHNSFEERLNFEQFVVIWLTSRYHIFIVVKMKVLCQNLC